MEKIENHIRIKVKGKTVDVVREQYLRRDVICRSALCAKCEHSLKVSSLPPDVTHYLIPFSDVVLNYLEILEFPEIRGIIFPQTVAIRANQEGKRLYNKLRDLIQDSRKGCVLFVNEFCLEAFQQRQEGESLSNWQNRNIFNVGLWYWKHLDQNQPIVMITEDKEIISRFKDHTDGVLLSTMQNYLQAFWSHLPMAYDIYESLTVLQALESTSTDTASDYEEYISTKLLEIGTRTGLYQCGVLKVNKHHSQLEAFVATDGSHSLLTKESHNCILISGMKHRNRAIHGDVVYVQLLPRSQWQVRIRALSNHDNNERHSICSENNSDIYQTGRVVGIFQRRWRDYVAIFSQEEKFRKAGVQDRLLAIPYDYRIPKIRIQTRQASSLENHRIIVRIDSWETNSQYPNGHFVRSLGKRGEIETETNAILIENEIRVSPFSPAVLKELPVNSDASPWTMADEEVTSRRDLRETHLIYSIDPKGCEDVDDALSVRNLPRGCVELGVHIADVTHFIRTNSFADQEARMRGTTVYLADRRHDMIPSVLSSDLCSLLGNVDRYAVSVLWTLNKKYEIIDVWYGRTIIKSSYKLFYEAAQMILDGATLDDLKDEISPLKECNVEKGRERLDTLRNSLSILTSIAHNLKSKRFQAGALDLESNEVQCEFGNKGSGKVENIIPREALDVHETVAECMILANHWVAKKIFESFTSNALLRHHPPPRQEQFANLLSCAASQGFVIDTTSNRLLAMSLNSCNDPIDPNVNKLMRNMAVQAMTNAQYCSSGSVLSEDYFHYGLALDFYTHFTSPIRRYADVMVHRQLLAAIGGDIFYLPANTALQDLCNHINETHRAAQNAQKASVELFQNLFFGEMPLDDPRRTVDAVIFNTRTNGVLVYVPKYGVKGPLYLCNKSLQVAFVTDNGMAWTDGSVVREPTAVSVQTSLGSQRYELFDHITVFIDTETSHAHPPSLKMELVSNRPHPEWDVNAKRDVLARNKLVLEVTSAQQLRSSWSELDQGHDGAGKRENKASSALSSFYQLLQSLKEMSLKMPKS